MTDPLERSLQDLRFDLPAGLVERAKAAASGSAVARPFGRRTVRYENHFWAPALVAVLLAIAIVATLLFVAHQRQAVPAQPTPHRATPYTIASPPSVAGGCSSMPRQWASVPANPAKMLSRTIGWAYGPMRTTDGGLHWVDASPPSVPGRTPTNAEYFLDGIHAWVAETVSSSAACVDHVVVFSTVDAGKTWQQAAPISVRSKDPRDALWTGENNHIELFDFVDVQHGWLLLGSGTVDRASTAGVSSSWVGAAWKIGDLYRTTDGGLNWTRVVTNPGSDVGCLPKGTLFGLNKASISFASESTGWMTSTCGLLVTHDAGSTWTKASTPLAATEPPIFFDATHGTVLAAGSLLETSNGGATWAVLPAQATFAGVDFIDRNDAWAVGIGPNTTFQCNWVDLAPCNGNFRLYRTSDGGHTWTAGPISSLMMPSPKVGWPPAYLHFVDGQNAFLSVGEDAPGQGVFRTTDSGRTWARVDGTVEGP
jgi:photosystem II stability/assembly factor-like uncharacterized protein